MPTIRDVAREAGVSPATVSRVVANYGYVSNNARERVLVAVQKVGYRPNAIARSMIKGATHTIGLIISDISNPFFPEVVRGVEDAAHRQGYNIILCNSDEVISKENDYIDVLLSKQVDGLIVASTSSEPGHLMEAAQRGTPLLLLDRHVPGTTCDVVKVDNITGARLAMEHLLDLRHQRIGLITGPKRVSTARDRTEGYRLALENRSIPCDERLVINSDFKEKGGYEGLIQLMALEHKPTAIFTANNLTTAGALTALRTLGLRIPDDISIVAFDDMTWMRLVEPQLTVVQQPMYLMGTTATEILLHRMLRNPNEPQQVMQLQANLVVRGSAHRYRQTENLC